jgi:hypothetical protein
LFDIAADAAQPAGTSFFSDLNLDQVFAAVVKGREEYELSSFFRIPLHDMRAVAYRQEVMRDLDNQAVSVPIAAFAGRMRDMRKHLTVAARLRPKYQKERWFLDAAGIYCDAVRVLADSLAAIDVQSRGLARLRDYVAGYAQSAVFTSLAAEAAGAVGVLAEVRYCVNVKGNRVRVTSYDGEPDYSAEVTRTFAKFARDEAKDYRATFRSGAEMNHVEERILAQVAQLFPEAFGVLDDFCIRHAGYLDEVVGWFDREIQFYAAYLDFIRPMKEAGLEFCYPDVSCDSKDVTAADAFDLALAHKLTGQGKPVITNSFRLDDPERIFVVTGPNQGGKTTFARMFGQLHYLASLGYPVPASRARLFLPDQVYTHFEREEDLATLRGKFEDELIRIRDVLDQASGDSVVIMNESFGSTTLQDALLVGERVLDRMTRAGLLGVYVTFVDELASLNEACVSMVGAVAPDSPAERTYKIVRRPADGLAYAAAIAGRYGLTYQQLKERLAS